MIERGLRARYLCDDQAAEADPSCLGVPTASQKQTHVLERREPAMGSSSAGSGTPERVRNLLEDDNCRISATVFDERDRVLFDPYLVCQFRLAPIAILPQCAHV
jgi:hypothetical protein